jgi:hypothetical protein
MPLPPQDITYLQTMYAAAFAAAQAYTPWPLGITMQEYAECAACEAAEETGWGKYLPKGSNNELGIMQLGQWAGPSVTADGTEQEPDGVWDPAKPDKWCVFPDAQTCFSEQLKILATAKSHGGALLYAAALAATTPEDYITAECHVWSTGLAKGQQVTIIYENHGKALGSPAGG